MTVTTNHKGKSSSKSSYRPEIDGLRALAVIGVLINHFNKDILPSGYLGVDIFFVISGYVITASLTKRKASSFKGFIFGFYSRRLKRLLPSLLFCIGITTLLVCLFNPTPEVSLRTGITALFGFSNIYLFQQATDYFGSSAEFNFFTQTWSLGVEQQFYLIFPFLIWLTGFCQQKKASHQKLFIILGLLSIVSLGLYIYWSQINHSAAYFLMPSRFWELGLGSMFFIILQRFPIPSQKLSARISWLVIFLMIALFFTPLTYQVPTTIAMVFLTIVLMVFLCPGTSTYQLLTIKSIGFLGVISYSLYLWHWSIIVVSRWTIGIHWWSIPIQLGLMVILALFSYYYIESPLRHRDWSIGRMKTMGVGVSVMTISTGSLTILDNNYQNLYLGQHKENSTIPGESQLWKDSKSCNIFETLPETIKSEECGSIVDPKLPTIYILGDSHGGQFAPAIAKYTLDNNQNYSVIIGNSCPFPSAALSYKPCNEGQEKAANLLFKSVKSGDTVIIGNALYAHFSGDWVVNRQYFTSSGEPISQQQALDIYLSTLKEIAITLKNKGVNVIVYLDSAQFPSLPDGVGYQICSPQWFRIVADMCTKDYQEFMAFRRPIEEGLKQLNYQGIITLWDGMDETTCQEDRCFPTHYIDSNHFSIDYASYLFWKFINRGSDTGS
ncbi:MAG: acyltransferase family protein [Crocosphaera sp.]